MSLALKNGTCYIDGLLEVKDLYIDDEGILHFDPIDTDETIDCSGKLITAGLIDTHVHFREPGFEYKETIKTGSLSAAKGGYTTVFSMPNLKPVPSNREALLKELEIIKKDALINVIPYASITIDQSGRSDIVDMESLADLTVGFSDDGKGVQTADLMREAMKQASKLDRIIVAHCEDESLLVPGGCVHEGNVSKRFSLPGISSESEYAQVIRDISLSEETDCRYHVCHVSTTESVDAIRKAKEKGLKVSGEVTVHHLLLNEDDITEDDGRFKMNPPLRSVSDQKSLIDGLNDKTLEVIATDHAPHSDEEKAKGLSKSAMGIIGSELAFGLTYTYLVKTGKAKLETVIDAMTVNPARIMKIDKGIIQDGKKADLSLFDLEKEVTITRDFIVSKGKSTPFIGKKMTGICLMTITEGRIAYRKDI